jgi:leader peptidase (prepilin peptidase)/N-methyltransferase
LTPLAPDPIIAAGVTDPFRAFLIVWVAFVGACVGSFLNVVIARVPAGESVVSPGSRCPSCRTPIRWYDNLPVASWLVLRGRCRRCGARISPRYLGVELLGAAIALAAFLRHVPEGQPTLRQGAAAGAELAFVATLVALAFIDLGTWLLPHALTWPLLGAGLVASALRVSAAPSLASSAVGAAAGFAVFAAIAWLGKVIARKEAMGLGDVWLLAGIGAWEGARALLPVVLLASLQGSVVGLALVAIGRAQPGPAPGAPPPGDDAQWVPPKNAVPFGPFLALAAVEWLWLADRLAAIAPALDVFR